MLEDPNPGEKALWETGSDKKQEIWKSCKGDIWLELAQGVSLKWWVIFPDALWLENCHYGYLLKEGQTRYIALRGGDTAGHTLTVPGINMLRLLNIRCIIIKCWHISYTGDRNNREAKGDLVNRWRIRDRGRKEDRNDIRNRTKVMAEGGNTAT